MVINHLRDLFFNAYENTAYARLCYFSLFIKPVLAILDAKNIHLSLTDLL